MKKIIFPLVLILFSLIISILNYIPGTYLSGWDTIHPEFDFPEYFFRSMSVWQSHQGLGAVAAQAHASELPRLIFYYLFSFIFPDPFLRYFYFFLTLFFGPLGVYFFIKEFIAKRLDWFNRETISFIGGLTYLLNLTTLQNYFVPLEMFATHYATIGWIFLFALKFLEKPNKKYFALVVLSIFFSIPMAHTPTLFYAFFGVFSLFIFTHLALNKISIKRGLVILLTFLILNGPWLLPNIYYVLSYGKSVTESKIHSQFSDRAFQVGTIFGNFNDTALLRNFLFSWGQYDSQKGQFEYLLKNWQSHLEKFYIWIIGLGIFFGVIGGIFVSLVKKQKDIISYLPLFLIPLFFIDNDNFIFNFFVNFLDNYLPVLKESLRFPFTKFSILLLFSYCIYFSYLLIFLAEKIKTKINLYKLYIIIIPMLLILYTLPMFTGNLIAKSMKVKIPNEYFQLYNFFNKEDSTGRIALLPAHTFWGWSYYKWGYEGAGFLWFGLRQPLLNREFDRWMPYNESFYWEYSYAIYSKNPGLLESVLDKYQVKWLLIDNSIIDVSSAKSPYLSEFESLIEGSKKIKFEKEFDDLKIYKFSTTLSPKKNISVLTNLPEIGPKFNKNNLDYIYLNNGDYITSGNKDVNVYFPFASLFTNQLQKNLKFEVKETEDEFIFVKNLPLDLKKYELKENENYKKINWYDSHNLEIQGVFSPSVTLNSNQILVRIPKIKGLFSSEIDPIYEISLKNLKDCDFLSLDITGKFKDVSNEEVKEGNKRLLRLNSTLANNCSANFLLPNLDHNNSYIINIENRNIKNKSLLFWLENLNSRRTDIEQFLPYNSKLNKTYFIQPPMEEFGKGYTLHFDNWSYKKDKSINDLGKISVYPIPYYFLKSLSFVKRENLNEAMQKIDECDVDVTQKQKFLYIVFLKKDVCLDKDKTLIFYQSFDKGWLAFYFDGIIPKLVGKHVLVNNWANGWEIKDIAGKKVYIFYLPQLLQFLGFIFYIPLIIYLIKRK